MYQSAIKRAQVAGRNPIDSKSVNVLSAVSRANTSSALTFVFLSQSRNHMPWEGGLQPPLTSARLEVMSKKRLLQEISMRSCSKNNVPISS
jgi:hypothetical protein